MSDYKEYVEAVNKIFDYVNKMKKEWDNPDNLNYLEKIEDYKEIVIDVSNRLKYPKKVEELGQ